LGDEIDIIAEARRFLHHQVRNMVGTLVKVGYRRCPASWLRAV
jgi:tRNA pseudouridine38-40 synthase